MTTTTITQKEGPMATKEARPLRICDLCGGLDDHPRHVIAQAPGSVPVSREHLAAVLGDTSLDAETKTQLAVDITDTSIQQRHMDCCREAGCPDGSCDAIAATGAESLRGEALLKHLTSGKIDNIGAQSEEN